MSERKPGQKTMRFLGKRMRLGSSHTGWWEYTVGNWEVDIFRDNSSGEYSCSLGTTSASGYARSGYYPTAEAAIAECETHCLELFR